MAPNNKTFSTDRKPIEPVQIIDFNVRPDRPSQLSLNKEALREVLRPLKDIPIHVLSITGASRQGKSFLLTVLLYLLTKNEEEDPDGHSSLINEEKLTGFPFENGVDRKTIGFWLWPRPFIFTRSDGSKIAVLVMDTQGVFDQYTTKRDWSMIVGLSLLTSSCVVYNLMGNLQEDTLEIFNNFVAFGMMSLANDANSPSPFQELVFLIRDWNIPESYPYGWTGGSQFLEKKLKPHPGMPQELKNVRDHLKSCFDEVKCFLMPYPGDAAKRNDFKGDLKNLDSDFQKFLEQFTEGILNPDSMREKYIASTRVDGPQLFNYFEKYVKAFNQATFPKPQTLYEVTMAANLEALAEKAKAEFEKESAKILDEDESMSLTRYKQRCEKLAVNIEKGFLEESKSVKMDTTKKRIHSILKTDLFRLLQTVLASYESKRNSRVAAIAKTGATFYFEIMEKEVGKQVFLLDQFHKYSQTTRENAIAKIKETTDCEGVLDEVLTEMENEILTMENTLSQQNESRLQTQLRECEGAIQAGVESYRKAFKFASVANNNISKEKLKSIHKMAEDEAIEIFLKQLSLENEELRKQAEAKFRSEIMDVLDKIAGDIKSTHEQERGTIMSVLGSEEEEYFKNMGAFMQKSNDERDTDIEHRALVSTAISNITPFIIDLSPLERQKVCNELKQKLEESRSSLLAGRKAAAEEREKWLLHEAMKTVESSKAEIMNIQTNQEFEAQESACLQKAIHSVPNDISEKEKTTFIKIVTDSLLPIFQAAGQRFHLNVSQAEGEVRQMIRTLILVYNEKLDNHIAINSMHLTITSLTQYHDSLAEECTNNLHRFIVERLPHNSVSKYAQEFTEQTEMKFKDVTKRLKNRESSVSVSAENSLKLYAGKIQEYFIQKRWSPSDTDTDTRKFHAKAKTEAMKSRKRDSFFGPAAVDEQLSLKIEESFCQIYAENILEFLKKKGNEVAFAVDGIPDFLHKTSELAQQCYLWFDSCLPEGHDEQQVHRRFRKTLVLEIEKERTSLVNQWAAIQQYISQTNESIVTLFVEKSKESVTSENHDDIIRTRMTECLENANGKFMELGDLQSVRLVKAKEELRSRLLQCRQMSLLSSPRNRQQPQPTARNGKTFAQPCKPEANGESESQVPTSSNAGNSNEDGNDDGKKESQ